MNFYFLPSFVLIAALSGCGGGSTAKYIPQATQAKEAVTVALDAWKKAETPDPAGKLASGAMITAVDMDWSAGQKLENFEIGPEIAGTADGPRKNQGQPQFRGRKARRSDLFCCGARPGAGFSR